MRWRFFSSPPFCPRDTLVGLSAVGLCYLSVAALLIRLILDVELSQNCLRPIALPYRLLPLHSVQCTGTFRISLCVLCTNDHINWTPFLYQGEISSKDTHPAAKVLLQAFLLGFMGDGS